MVNGLGKTPASAKAAAIQPQVVASSNTARQSDFCISVSTSCLVRYCLMVWLYQAICDVSMCDFST